MESTYENTKIEVITSKEIEGGSSIGRYLKKHIVPGLLYIVEHVPNLMASCLYNISKPMLVFSSKACGGQLLMESAESEIDANPSKLKNKDPYLSYRELMICKMLSTLEKKPIWIDDSEKLMAVNLYARCEKLRMDHDLQVVLLDDYQFLVDDYFQEISDELRLTMLQKLAEKMGIAVIAQKCPIDETQEGNKGNALEPVFHNRWWDDTPKREQNNSLFDYWEA